LEEEEEELKIKKTRSKRKKFLFSFLHTITAKLMDIDRSVALSLVQLPSIASHRML